MSLISLNEAAERTATSVWTWRKWASLRAIPTVKLGRRRLVDEADVERLIAAARVEADERFALDIRSGQYRPCQPARSTATRKERR